VSFSNDYGKVTLREFGDIGDIDGTTVIVGFPSVSLASILTAGFLREQLNLPSIGVISSDHFPARAIIEGGRPSHPIRIFGDKRLVIVICEFKIPTNELSAHVVDAIVSFAARHKAKMLVCIEGLPSENVDKETGLFDEKLHFISTNKEFSECMIDLQHKPLSDAVITGVTGLTLSEGVMHDVDIGCLLAPAAVHYPDAYGAVNVVKTLAKWLKDVKIDTAPLEKSAINLQKSVTGFLQKEKESSRASTDTAMFS